MIFWILSKMDKFFTVLNVFIKWKFILKFIFQHLQRRSDQQFIISFIGRMSSTVFVPVYQYNIIFQNFLLRFLWCKQEFFPCSAMPSILSVFLAEFGHFLLLLHILLHFAHHLLINFTSERFFTLSHFGLQLPPQH